MCFMAEYFLPDVSVLTALPCDYELKILYAEDFQELYTAEWSNALCEKRKELDVLGVGAYYNGKLIGMAHAPQTVKPCGRLELTCFRNIVEKE